MISSRLAILRLTALVAVLALGAIGGACGGGGGTSMGPPPPPPTSTPTPTPKPVNCLVAHAAHAMAAWVGVRPTKPAAIPRRLGSGPAVHVCGNAGPGYMRCMAWKRTDWASPAIPGGYGPSDLQGAYNLPSGTNGVGQTVAVVDAYDDPKAEADLGVYRSTFSLPACTTANGCFLKVNQSGGTSPLPVPDPMPCSGPMGCWEEEEALDIDMVSATCPNCHILLVETDSPNNTDLYAGEDAAATKCGANEISNSCSGGEYASEATDDVHFNRPGIPITVASGDSGYPGGYPAASQYVTAVGGTTLCTTSNTSGPCNGTPSETVWKLTGSLCSIYINQPSWQSNSPTVMNNSGVCSMRINNDVSAVADTATPVAVYTTFGSDHGWLGFGGTSVATPIIAGVYALAGNGTSIHDGSYSYSHTSSLHDITSGNNDPCGLPPANNSYVCTAGAGYDGPTGNGTPNGVGAF